MTVRKTDAEPVPEGRSGGPSDGVEAGPSVQRPPAEVRYAQELAALRADDRDPRPPGWAVESAGGAQVRHR